MVLLIFFLQLIFLYFLGELHSVSSSYSCWRGTERCAPTYSTKPPIESMHACLAASPQVFLPWCIHSVEMGWKLQTGGVKCYCGVLSDTIATLCTTLNPFNFRSCIWGIFILNNTILYINFTIPAPMQMIAMSTGKSTLIFLICARVIVLPGQRVMAHFSTHSCYPPYSGLSFIFSPWYICTTTSHVLGMNGISMTCYPLKGWLGSTSYKPWIFFTFIYSYYLLWAIEYTRTLTHTDTFFIVL